MYASSPFHTRATRLASLCLAGALAIPMLLAASPIHAAAAAAGVVMVNVAQTGYVDNDGSGDVSEGDQLDFTETATNVGGIGLTNVQFFNSGATCNTLAVNAVCQGTYSATVDIPSAQAGSFQTTAYVNATELPGTASSYPIFVPVHGSAITASVTLALTSQVDNDHSGTITPGDVLTYTLTAQNSGQSNIQALQVSNFVAITNAQSGPPAKTAICSNLTPGATCTVDNAYTVTASSSQDGSSGITASGYAKITYGPGNGSTFNAAPVFTPTQNAVGAGMFLSSTVTGYSSAILAEGVKIHYSLAASNTGSVTLTNVAISSPDTVPDTKTCASVPVGEACVLDTDYTITATDVANGATPDTSFQVTATEVSGPFPGELYPITVDGLQTIAQTGMQILSGNQQTGAPGDSLPTPLTVQIPGPGPVAGQAVDFTVLTSNATVSASQVFTDAQGKASTQLTLGAATGAVLVEAHLRYGSQTPGAIFTATISNNLSPATLRIVSGNYQSVPVNTPSAPLTVLLTRDGNPLANETITWTGKDVKFASPTVPATSQTDSSGHASIVATPLVSGPLEVTATPNTTSSGPVTFAINQTIAITAGLTPAQIAVANSLDHACAALADKGSLSPAQEDLIAQCQALLQAPSSEVGHALDQMMPRDALLQTNASVLAAQAQFDNLKARLSALRGGGGGHFGGLAFANPGNNVPIGTLADAALGMAARQADAPAQAGSGFDRWGFFLSGTFSDGSSDPRALTPGYGFHSNGVTAGVDYRVNDGMILGLSAGYARFSSAVDAIGGGLDTHGWSLSFYSTFFRKDNWYFDSVLTWGKNRYDIDRRIVYALTTNTGTVAVNQAATSNSDGTTLAAALSVGRDFAHGPWSFGPYLRGTWTRTHFGDYQETMISGKTGSGLGLVVAGRTATNVASVLGAKLNYASSQSWGVLMPHVEVEWEHDFQNNPDSITAHFLQDPTATPFHIRGDNVDVNFFRAGLGLSFQFTQGRSGFVYYEKTLGQSGITQDSIALGFRMEF